MRPFFDPVFWQIVLMICTASAMTPSKADGTDPKQLDDKAFRATLLTAIVGFIPFATLANIEGKGQMDPGLNRYQFGLFIGWIISTPLAYWSTRLFYRLHCFVEDFRRWIVSKQKA